MLNTDELSEALKNAEEACLLLLKCCVVYTKDQEGYACESYLAPKAFHPALSAARKVIEAKIARKDTVNQRLKEV